MKIRKNQKGFTLVEVLLASSLIALVGVYHSQLLGSMFKSQTAIDSKSDFQNLVMGMQLVLSNPTTCGQTLRMANNGLPLKVELNKLPLAISAIQLPGAMAVTTLQEVIPDALKNTTLSVENRSSTVGSGDSVPSSADGSGGASQGSGTMDNRSPTAVSGQSSSTVVTTGVSTVAALGEYASGTLRINRLQIDSLSNAGKDTRNNQNLDKYVAKVHLEASSKSDLMNRKVYSKDFFVGLLADSQTREVAGCFSETSEYPVSYDIIPPDLSTWGCVENIDIKDICGGELGCTISFNMQHKTYYDYVTTFTADMFLEQPSLSNNTWTGLTGQIAWPYYNWFALGDGRQMTVLQPYQWAYVFNYTHQYCPNPVKPINVPYTDPYRVSLLVHPYVKAKITFHKKTY